MLSCLVEMASDQTYNAVKLRVYCTNNRAELFIKLTDVLQQPLVIARPSTFRALE